MPQEQSEPELTRLEVDYVLNAIQLARSFIHEARDFLRSRNYEEVERLRHTAEHFYCDAGKMLELLNEIDTPALVSDLGELRKALDGLTCTPKIARD